MVRFKRIVGWPGYKVGEDGSVWSRNKGPWRKLVGYVTKKGYTRVLLSNNYKTKKVFVHVLVLHAFVGPCPEGMESCHRDGNSSNNTRTNLRWGTHQSNCMDTKNHGTMILGERHHKAKLTTEQVKEVRSLYATGKYSQRELGRMYATSSVTIGRIYRGDTRREG